MGEKVKLADYIGSFNFLGSALAKMEDVPDPSVAQVRQFLTEYAILPLGSPLVKQYVQPVVHSILLVGGPGSGKTMLAHAIANETGANFFNLSPSNTDGIYPGKQSYAMVHTVLKVAKALAPSVIYIDDAETVFI